MHELNSTTIKYPLRKSFVVFLDILGFSKRFPKEKEACIELLAQFIDHNGEYCREENSEKKSVRPFSTAASNSIVMSIPANYELENPDAFFEPLLTILNGVSYFAYLAIKKGFMLRGAISYGDMCHQGYLIAGEPHIEAVEDEKKAESPRVILSNSLKHQVEKYAKNKPYCWKYTSETYNYLSLV